MKEPDPIDRAEEILGKILRAMFIDRHGMTYPAVAFINSPELAVLK